MLVLQMEKKWSFEDGIHQAMVAKRMLLAKLHKDIKDSKLSFIGFQISKTVWSNQLNIIPLYMKIIATLMRLSGSFISIDKCGKIMAPLFIENQEESQILILPYKGTQKGRCTYCILVWDIPDFLGVP
jgi:hypothetical protein